MIAPPARGSWGLGSLDGVARAMVIENENGLWIFIPIMTALALIGLVLAAHYKEGVYHYAGFSLFVVSVLWILGGLKSYYDAKERQQHQH
jgi:hypothetical protein